MPTLTCQLLARAQYLTCGKRVGCLLNIDSPITSTPLTHVADGCYPRATQLRLQLRPLEEPVRARAPNPATARPLQAQSRHSRFRAPCLRSRPKRNIRTAMNHEVMMYAIAQAL